MANETTIESRATSFIEKLSVLDPGERARLKRNAGRTLTESREATGLFYRLLPPSVPASQEETYFLVATLYPLAENGGTGSLGETLRRAKTPKNEKGLDRRVEILLDSDPEQMPFRLRQAVHFLQSNRIKIHWTGLLEDLLQWNHPDRYIQHRWAKDYFKKNPVESK